MNALSGKAPKPTVKPPYPFERGLGGAPTLVQNAETLAHVALIARFGARWFRSVGIEAEPGTALVSLSGAVRRPGVYEVELGTRVSELVQEAGGATEALSAFLVGGYFGGWTRDPAHPLTAAGGLGAGVVIAFPADSCGVRESARVTRYLASETAGQCGPCVHGLAALASGLEEIAAPGRTPTAAFSSRAGHSRSRRAARAGIPDGAARFVAEHARGLRGRVRRSTCTKGAAAARIAACCRSGARVMREAAAGRPDRVRRPRSLRGAVPRVDRARRLGLPDHQSSRCASRPGSTCGPRDQGVPEGRAAVCCRRANGRVAR